MRDYGRVYSTFWSSETTAGLSDDGKLLALYLLTCPHATIAGVFRLPDGYVAEDLRWTQERVVEGFRELFNTGFADRCETTRWVWVRKHLEWNPPENPNQRKAAVKVALSVPDACAWKRGFMRASAAVLALVVPSASNPSATVAKPFPNQEQEQEQKQEQKQEQEQAAPSGAGAGSPTPNDPPPALPPEGERRQQPRITDPVEIIFGYGVPILMAAGAKEKNARSFLGKLRGWHGDPAVIDALRDCMRTKPLQPTEWLAKRLPPPPTQGEANADAKRRADTDAEAKRLLGITDTEVIDA